jgi:hypothetical protein
MAASYCCEGFFSLMSGRSPLSLGVRRGVWNEVAN